MTKPTRLIVSIAVVAVWAVHGGDKTGHWNAGIVLSVAV